MRGYGVSARGPIQARSPPTSVGVPIGAGFGFLLRRLALLTLSARSSSFSPATIRQSSSGRAAQPL